MVIFMSIFAIVLALLRFPLYLSFFLSSSIALFLFRPISINYIISIMYGSLNHSALFAVPAFIFAGEVMARGGMAERLIKWILSLLGDLKGGVAFATVGACGMFGAISGSSPATVAVVGKILYPGLREKSYPESFSLSIITVSSAMAIVIPPSITMIVYGSLANVSVSSLFIAGFIPGIIIALSLSAYILYFSYRYMPDNFDKNNQVSAKKKAVSIIQTTKETVWTLGAPVIIFGGIYSGIFTPTEAAGVVAMYALLISFLVYKEMTLQRLFEITLASAKLTAKIFIIMATAAIFSWVITVSGTPRVIVEMIGELNLSKNLVLLSFNIILLVAGMFLDPMSALLILVPLFSPVIRLLGVNLIHFGIIITVNLAIGMFTPPFGLNIFVSTSIFNVDTNRVIRGIVPFLVCNLIALTIITYFPLISLWLPNLIGK